MSNIASLVWSTPDGDSIIARLARVSNPDNQDNTETAPKLIRYLIRNKHWSPFEMASMCVEVNTTRDIGRQLLRHKLRPQEFSQRYADVGLLDGGPILSETRLQDPKNRQASIECTDFDMDDWWQAQQQEIWDHAASIYQGALERGIAKEQARKVLPEGLTPTRMYFVGEIRNWLHFTEVRRREAGAQKEIAAIAADVERLLAEHYPATWAAWCER